MVFMSISYGSIKQNHKYAANLHHMIYNLNIKLSDYLFYFSFFCMFTLDDHNTELLFKVNIFYNINAIIKIKAVLLKYVCIALVFDLMLYLYFFFACLQGCTI